MSEALFTSLAQSGVLGIVLAWFMLRLEGILKDNTIALNALTLAINKLDDRNGKTSA